MGRKSARRMNWTWPIWFIENDRCRTFSMKTWRKSWPEIPSRPPMCPWWPVSQKNPSLTPPKTKMPCYLLQNNGRLDTKQWNCLKTTEVGTPSALAFWSLGEEETIFFFSIPRSQKKKWSIFFVHHQLKSNPMTKIMWKDTLNILIPFHRSNCLKETCPRHLSTSGTLAAWMAAVASIQEVFTKEKEFCRISFRTSFPYFGQTGQ